MDVLLQNFSQEIAGDMGGLLFLTAESVAEHKERSLLVRSATQFLDRCSVAQTSMSLSSK